jgi:hypothetical protein
VTQPRCSDFLTRTQYDGFAAENGVMWVRYQAMGRYADRLEAYCAAHRLDYVTLHAGYPIDDLAVAS